jgi:hypothetical protein
MSEAYSDPSPNLGSEIVRRSKSEVCSDPHPNLESEIERESWSEAHFDPVMQKHLRLAHSKIFGPLVEAWYCWEFPTTNEQYQRSFKGKRKEKEMVKYVLL